MVVGARAQVMHGTADKTSGGLMKKNLKYNKRGKIVSIKQSKTAKRNNRLVRAGYVTRKGKFGSILKSKTRKNNRSVRAGWNKAWIDPIFKRPKSKNRPLKKKSSKKKRSKKKK